MYTWMIAVMQFFVFELVSFVARARAGVLLLKAVNFFIAAGGQWVLVPMPDRLGSLITGLGFFKIIRERGLHPVVAYVDLCLVQEVCWSCNDLKFYFILCCWRTRKMIGLSGRRVHDDTGEVDEQLVHNERLF